jgi:hypothetical protein
MKNEIEKLEASLPLSMYKNNSDNIVNINKETAIEPEVVPKENV